MVIKKLVVFEWISTAIIILGVFLTSRDFYPYNLFFATAGNFMWMIVGIYWKQWSLITVQAIMTIIYAYGLIYYFT